jgi:uncharacterized protein YcaQ
MQSLSIADARKLALLSQGLPPKPQKGSAYANTLAAFERLGYVQIDTISVVQRAHHHVLWSRNPGYRAEHLDKLVAEKKVFEYWSHAASYLPMRDYRFSLVRKNAIKTGEQNHWFKRDHKLMDGVYRRIADEGPLMAKDFESESRKINGWGSKLTKQALETLYMQGDLMISERRNFHKVYDLTERVVPQGIDTSLPSEQEYGRFLVLNYLRAHGLGARSEMSYLLKEVKAHVDKALKDLQASGDIELVSVAGESYYASVDSLDLLNNRLSRKQAKILSPFDNLLIQRKRARALFGFDYLLECYVPAAKRRYGYFCLPVLWDGRLVARADCKAERKARVLEVINLFIEPGLKQQDAFMVALQSELQSFAAFNQCDDVVLQKISVA